MTEKTSALPRGVKLWGTFLAWFLGPLILGAFCWILSQPIRNRGMIRQVNQVLSMDGMPYRLEGAIAPWGMKGQAMQVGTWYRVVNSETWAVVFSIFQGGVNGSFLALISPEGAVDSLIPLSAVSLRMLDQLSQGVLELYTRRIEASAALLRAEGGSDG